MAVGSWETKLSHFYFINNDDNNKLTAGPVGVSPPITLTSEKQVVTSGDTVFVGGAFPTKFLGGYNPNKGTTDEGLVLDYGNYSTWFGIPKQLRIWHTSDGKVKTPEGGDIQDDYTMPDPIAEDSFTSTAAALGQIRFALETYSDDQETVDAFKEGVEQVVQNGGATTSFGLPNDADWYFSFDNGGVKNLGNGDDLGYGGEGNDVIGGGRGDDIVYAKSGFNILSGDSGNDWIIGGDEKDFLFGGSGDDEIEDLGGGAVMSGGSGNDILKAGEGYNVLKGGRGEDTFTATAFEFDGDWIKDFEVGDTIIIEDFGFDVEIATGWFGRSEIKFDTDNDGSLDGTIRLGGFFGRRKEFDIDQTGDDTIITVLDESAGWGSGWWDFF